jgi:hypothetical protein
LFCFDHAGNELWRTSIGTDSPDWGYAASVVGFEDLLIVNASVESGAVLGLDKKTGEEVWRNEEGVGQGMNEISRSTPLIFTNAQGQKRMALMVAGQFLQVYDPATGEVLWKEGRYSGGYASNTAVPNADGSGLYCFFGGSHGTTEAVAFRTGDGVDERKIWQVEHVGHGLVPPVLYQGRLYYGAYGGVKPAPAQGFGCLDAETGEKIFHVQPEEFGDNIYSPALAGDGKVYIQTQLSGVWVLDAGTEFEVRAKNVLDEDLVETKMNMAERKTGNTSGNGYIAMPVPLEGGRLLLRGFWGLHCVEAPR